MNPSVASIFIPIPLLLLLHHAQTKPETILLVNGPSNPSIHSYTILPIETNNRIKRDDISSDERCDEHVYSKLYRCSHLTDCQSIATCLDSIKCPSTVQSYGSLIVNLLHLLGGTQCQNHSLDSSCSHEQRSIILHNLLTHWTDNHFNIHQSDFPENKADREHYCKTIHEFIIEVQEEVKAQCLIYSRQVEAFLENYLCSNKQSPAFASNLIKTTSLNGDSPLTKVNETLKDLPPALPNLDYLDYDTEFNFINTNQDLINTTEQTIFVNDHQYYNVSYIIPKSAEIPLNFIPDYALPFVSVHNLVDRHRAAISVPLKFNFPFYGHVIRRILVATGGFIYTGDLLHSSLIGSTQYVAPFMANFDLSLGAGQSSIKYFDNTTHFICTWANLYLQDQRELGPFTFQTILKSDGNIYFNYQRIPSLNISNQHHSHRIGLSDAYVSQHETIQHTIHVITLYDKINLDRDKIQDGVSILLKMDNICNTYNDCTSCLANRGKRYNCSWCETVQRCSDGNDRSRHQWIRAQCHRNAAETTCPSSLGRTFDPAHYLSLPSAIHSNDEHDELDPTFNSHSAYYTFRTIAITLLLTVLILSLIAFVGTYVYAYRHPTSPAGMWLIEHRPSAYIARFKRASDRNDEST